MPDRVDQPVPEVLTFLLAEVVHQDPDNGKFSALGIHKIIGAPSFPLYRPTMVVYVELTDGRGKTALELRLVDVDEIFEPVFALEASVDFADNPNEIIETVFNQAGVTFPEPGEYRLQLFGSGQLLRERRLLVLPLAQFPEGEGEEL